MEINLETRNILICSDSQEAIKALSGEVLNKTHIVGAKTSRHLSSTKTLNLGYIQDPMISIVKNKTLKKHKKYWLILVSWK